MKAQNSGQKTGAAPRFPWLVPLVLSVALFMENMDSTVIATSLPAIAADIGSTPIALKLAFTAYFLALAILPLMRIAASSGHEMSGQVVRGSA